MDTKSIGRFLATCREESNMTQQQLADRLGVSNRDIANWEEGIGTPDISSLLQISELFHVGIDEILEARHKKASLAKKDYATRIYSVIFFFEEYRAVFYIILSILLGVALGMAAYHFGWFA